MTGSDVTGIVLTHNEAPNIERSPERLEFLERVLVVDSGSDDGTQSLARAFPNVVLVEHPFAGHAAQANFAIRSPQIVSDWVLALDADFLLSEALVAEIQALRQGDELRGYRVPVRYCIQGRPLRASLYPDVVALFDRRVTEYVQVGHAHKAVVRGETGRLRGEILHDDRKPFDRFLASQRSYALLEAERLRSQPWSSLPWSSRFRRLRFFTPWLVPLYVLFAKRVLLDGRAGVAYARERLLAELAISRALGRR